VAEELRAAGCPVLELEGGRRPLQALASVYHTIKRERPAVLHTFLFHSNLLGRLGGRMAGVPFVVASERSVEPRKAAWRVRADRLTWRLADVWTANAEAVARVLVAREGLTRDRIAVIPTSVDTVRFSPQHGGGFRTELDIGDEPLLLSVARLDPLKGHRTLLEAFSHITKVRPLAVLVLVGEGAERATLEAQASTLGLTARVRFTGGLADVRPALASADVFVLSSDAEGMPGAVLEAMAMGLPVVATDVGGTSEALDGGSAGVLVPPRDPQALAAAVAALLDAPERRRALGARGRALVAERYSVEHVVDETDALYRRLLNTDAICVA
jgi:glycosyltransferase involved in cell wall biosynthesis